MAAKFFGQYLIDQGLISGFDLARVLKFQEKNNLPFGSVAEKLGLMTPEEVASVHETQRKEGLPFGESAIDKGLLTPKQVDMVFKAQQQKHIPLGQALVSLGVLDQNQLAEHLKSFNTQLKVVTADDVALPADAPEHPRLKVIVQSWCTLLKRMTSLPFHLGPGALSGTIPTNHSICLSADFSGDLEVRLLLSMSHKTRILLSTSLLNDEKMLPPEIGVQNEALQDFTDHVARHVVNKARAEGHRLTVSPCRLDQLDKAGAVQQPEMDLFFPLFLPDGETVPIMLAMARG